MACRGARPRSQVSGWLGKGQVSGFGSVTGAAEKALRFQRQRATADGEKCCGRGERAELEVSFDRQVADAVESSVEEGRMGKDEGAGTVSGSGKAWRDDHCRVRGEEGIRVRAEAGGEEWRRGTQRQDGGGGGRWTAGGARRAHSLVTGAKPDACIYNYVIIEKTPNPMPPVHRIRQLLCRRPAWPLRD